MALIFANLDDMNSSSKAENLFTELIEENLSANENKVNEKGIKLKDEFIRFYLKQEKYEVKNYFFH